MKLLLTIARWIVGIILCLASIGGFAKGDYVAAAASLIIGLLLLPPTIKLFRSKKGAESIPVVMPLLSTAAIATNVNEAAHLVQQAQQKPGKSGGIAKWFKGWRTAIKVAIGIDGLIKQFPNFSQEKFDAFLQTRSSWSEADISTLRKRCIEGYDKNITSDNVETLGQSYLNFFLNIFPGDNAVEIRDKISLNKVEAFVFSRIKDDEALDPQEIQEIIAYSIQLQVEAYNTPEKVRVDYEYYITNWELDNALFKGIPCELILQRNELCLYNLGVCELLEKKSVTKRVGYSGYSGRIKITKGLSYRVGSYNVSSEKEIVDISKGKGALTVTTKRIIFKNADEIVSIDTKSITDIEPYSDAVIIFKNTGKPFTIKTASALQVYQSIRSAIRN